MTDINTYLYIKDLKGNEYPMQATLSHEMELNGNQSVSATIYVTKANSAFIDDITEMWELVDFDGVAHKIIYAKKKGEGNRLTVEVKAIPLFFDTFDTLRIYEEYNEHMTAILAFTRIFAGTGFNFVLVDAFDAVQWEGFGGGESRLETFKRALERYHAEFRIVGNTIYLHKRIGRDTQFQYRYRLNASNITQENDASAMWTYAKGYGDYEDGGEEGGGGGWETAKLVREYTSPLAKIIGIRHAPPIKDGRVKIKGAMDKALKELVDESLKISVSADIHDLRRQGYPLAQPELGDRVFLIDERIGLDEEVRVVDIKIMRNWKGEVLDLSLTFGSESITKRHQSNLNTAIKDITEVMAGRKKLPFSVLDSAVINATNALKGITSELVVPENGGLMAVDKNNPNNVVLFNAAGVGVSRDGGATFRTAMTGEGIIADVITTGTLNTDQVVVRGGDGAEYLYMSGAYLDARGKFRRTWRGETSTHDVSLRLENGYFRARNETLNQSLYFSDFGISTYADAEGGEIGSSGSIIFRDTTYTSANSLLLHSHAGAVAMRSDGNKIVLDANQTVSLESDEASIYLRPMRDNRPGINEFRFYIKDNASAAEADGVLVFGNSDTGSSCGLRFIKTTVGGPLIQATNGAGDLISGYFQALGFYGNTLDTASESSGSNLYVRANNEVRATKRGTSGTGSVYIPIRASSFPTGTSLRENKTDIEVFDEDALSIIRKEDVYLYRLKNAANKEHKQLGLMVDETPRVLHGEAGDSVEMYALGSFLWRGVKQLADSQSDLSGEVSQLKNIVEFLSCQLKEMNGG